MGVLPHYCILPRSTLLLRDVPNYGIDTVSEEASQITASEGLYVVPVTRHRTYQ